MAAAIDKSKKVTVETQCSKSFGLLVVTLTTLEIGPVVIEISRPMYGVFSVVTRKVTCHGRTGSHCNNASVTLLGVMFGF